MTKQKYISLILILGSLTALSPFSIDMYLPGFSGIAHDLNTTSARVALSLSSFFIGISFGQLLYGPLLDRYGRKKPLIFGLLLYIIASIGCTWVTSIDQLIVLRLIEAIGSCAAGVASVAMVRDLFPVKDSAKVFSLLMLMVGLSPMLAPTIGGYVTAWFGWQAVFLALASMGAGILLMVLFLLPESYTPNTNLSLKPQAILGNFALVAKQPAFYTYVLTGALAFGGLFAYVASSPLIFMELYHVDGKTYGWIFAFLSVAFIGANQVNTMLLPFYKSEQIVRGSLLSLCAVLIVFLTLALTGNIGLYGTIGFLFLYLSFLGLINPNTSALALAPFSQHAGSASALMGAMQMGMGTVASVAVSLFTEQSIVPMILIMSVLSLLSLSVLLLGSRSVITQVSTDQL